ncbi:MAG TPA: single-stranded DNA-binding protein [Solirubrobacteraceae bacterium]|nr:single-stranded DNA-binding protein [Solirubrobacteraceae bacterium]
MSIFSINRVVLVGRLTRDVELRSLPSGRSVATLRIACNSSSKKDAEGNRTERPNFFDVTVYGPAVESVARYTGKGSRIGVDGRLEWREWETAEQERRQAVGIVADVVQFLDGRSGASQEGDDDELGGGGDDELVGVGVDELDATF